MTLEPPVEVLAVWQARLDSVERSRAGNAEFWKHTLPRLYRDALVPAAEQFHAAVAAHVDTQLTLCPDEHGVVLKFEDWYLDRWSLRARLLPTTTDAAILELAAGARGPQREFVSRAAPVDPGPFIEWLAAAYLEHLSTAT